MPQSRNRKITKAKKRPRVPYANPTAGPSSSSGGGGVDPKVKIGVIVLLAVIVLAGVAYVVSRRNTPEASAEVVTPSGLRITDLRVGDGPSPKMGQSVSVHYVGRFEDGREFNNSYNMGRPVDFKLAMVIPAWQEALQSMKVGGKRKIFVPSKIGYGAAGNPPTIPPNANLEFEIELLAIK